MKTVIILMADLRNIGYLRFGIHIAIASALWVGIVGGVGYFCAETMMENINMLSVSKRYAIAILEAIGLLVWFSKHRPQNTCCLKTISNK